MGNPEICVVRGWLEGRYEDISIINDAIEKTVAEDWTNVLWTIPPKETLGQRYAFFGGTLLQNHKTWFLGQLQNLIALLPASGGHQLRGLFIATDEYGTSQWRIYGRQVLTDPTPPGLDYFNDTPRE